MACYHPLTAYVAPGQTRNGKRNLSFSPVAGYRDRPIKLPCGQCVGCRLEYSRQWAMRCVHEASLYTDNCFITLTYRPENLPPGGTLVKKHYQDFMKRLRKHFPNRRIRYYHCGEYGEKTARPHYHACLFNMSFDDLELISVRDGIRLYTSPTLEKIWGHGFVTVGDVTFQSAAYVARYIMKKITGKNAESHYQSVDPDTGEVFKIQPEYTTMSRKPGLAADWFEQFKSDVYPSDFVVMRGVKMRPPKFYDILLERAHDDVYTRVKNARVLAASKHQDNQTADRLHVRKTVKLSQIKSLKRQL